MVRSFLSAQAVPTILLCTILALIAVLILTFYVQAAKSKTGLNLLYMLVGGVFIGLVGLRASAINNPFFLYMVIMIWNLIAGTIHVFLSGKILEWPKNEHFGWNLLFGFAIVLTGFASTLMFMKLFDYDFFLEYNMTAILTFFIPVLFVVALDSYTAIPGKVYLAQKPWIYNRGEVPQFKGNEISHFYIIKYRLTTQAQGEQIESLPMRAPGNMKLGDYFNATLEVYKVSQGRYTIEVRDRSNNNLGWFFFLAEGSAKPRMLDPNRSFIELGFTNPVYFGNSSPEEVENLTMQADKERKSYTIICKRELEYKSQLIQA
jgi:hypothetical protein